jgi:hypothetical protein
MTIIKCGLNTCINNVEGKCQKENIELKWRFACDFPQLRTVCVECSEFHVEGVE